MTHDSRDDFDHTLLPRAIRCAITCYSGWRAQDECQTKGRIAFTLKTGKPLRN